MRYLLIIFLLTGSYALSQTSTSWRVELTSGLGYYKSESNISLKEGAAASQLGTLSLSYYIKDKLSIGLKLKSHNFFIDKANDTTTKVTQAVAGSLLFNTTYHLLNRSKFIWYGSINLGAAQMRVHLEHPTNGNEGFAELTGFVYGLETGIHKYFNKWLGLNVSLGFYQYRMVFTYLEANGSDVEYIRKRRVNESRANYVGPELQAGLTFRF